MILLIGKLLIGGLGGAVAGRSTLGNPVLVERLGVQTQQTARRVQAGTAGP